MAYGDYNPEKEKNEQTIKDLISDGYVDLGWANSGKKFSYKSSGSTLKSPMKLDELDCGLYSHRGTNTVYIDHINKEILHVDMSG